MTATFNATILPVADIVLSQSVNMQANIAAVDASGVGAYHVTFMVAKQNADGTWGTPTNVIDWNAAPMTQTPQLFTSPFTPPANPGSGRYKVSVLVQDANWAWQTTNQNDCEFNVGPAPAIYLPLTVPPPEARVVPIVKQSDGSYLPSTDNWQLIPGMSIVDSSVLDETKWIRKLWSYYGDNVDHLSDALNRYVDSAVTYNNGLVITATPRAGTAGHAPSPSGIQYPLFDSGMVRSVQTAKYFFAHMQVIFPQQLGIWPGWWIIPGDGHIDPNPEMDMMEAAWNGVNETFGLLHCNCSVNKALIWHDPAYNPQFGYLQPDPNFYSPTYWIGRPVDICILWSEDGTMTLYHDGNPTAKWAFPWVYQNGAAVSATMLMQLSIGGAWATDNWTTAVPTAPVALQVNFVKTYEKMTTIYGPPSTP